MALPNSNISVAMVKSELGAATNDVGQLCIHPNVNMWSKCKPVRYSSITPITQLQLQNTGSGLNRVDMFTVEYDKPRGGLSEPFRLTDFVNYNKTAIPPVNVSIIGVTELTTGQELSSPYVLLYTFQYRIYFKFPIIGEIDPVTIHPRTKREKPIGSNGDGGLSFVSGTSTVVDRLDSQVFSAPFQTMTYQDLVISQSGNMPVLRIQYCAKTDGAFQTLPYAIEDLSFLNEFSFEYLDITLLLNRLMWDNIAGTVKSILKITNNTSRIFNGFRLRYEYSINSGATKSTVSYPPIPVGESTTSVSLHAGTAGTSNSYSIYAILESQNAETSVWNEIARTNAVQTVVIPA